MFLMANEAPLNVKSTFVRLFDSEARRRNFQKLAPGVNNWSNQYSNDTSMIGFTFENAGEFLHLIFIKASNEASNQIKLQRLKIRLAIFDKSSGLWSAQGDSYTTKELIASIFGRLA